MGRIAASVWWGAIEIEIDSPYHPTESSVIDENIGHPIVVILYQVGCTGGKISPISIMVDGRVGRRPIGGLSIESSAEQRDLTGVYVFEKNITDTITVAGHNFAGLGGKDIVASIESGLTHRGRGIETTSVGTFRDSDDAVFSKITKNVPHSVVVVGDEIVGLRIEEESDRVLIRLRTSAVAVGVREKGQRKVHPEPVRKTTAIGHGNSNRFRKIVGSVRIPRGIHFESNFQAERRTQPVPDKGHIVKRWMAPLLLILATVGGATYYKLSSPPRPGPGEHLGIDVSSHQGVIDWPRVAADGVEFAYIKASEGGDWVDDHFARNWQGSGDAGLKRGAYHFFTLKRPGAEQAANFLRVAAPDSDSLPPVVDLEFGGNSKERPDREVVLAELQVFVEKVERAHGRPLILYLLPEFESKYQVRQALVREIWLRNLGARPSHEEWRIWQYTPIGRISGVQGGVDLNLMKY